MTTQIARARRALQKSLEGPFEKVDLVPHEPRQAGGYAPSTSYRGARLGCPARGDVFCSCATTGFRSRVRVSSSYANCGCCGYICTYLKSHSRLQIGFVSPQVLCAPSVPSGCFLGTIRTTPCILSLCLFGSCLRLGSIMELGPPQDSLPLRQASNSCAPLLHSLCQRLPDVALKPS